MSYTPIYAAMEDAPWWAKQSYDLTADVDQAGAYRDDFFTKQLTTTETRDGEKLIVLGPMEGENHWANKPPQFTQPAVCGYLIFSQCEFYARSQRILKANFAYDSEREFASNSNCENESRSILKTSH